MDAIQVENVSKSFRIAVDQKNTLKQYFLNPFNKPENRVFRALEDITFTVKKGEFLGIIGRNGSGKSTLLKLLAEIYLPDKGKISRFGKLVPFLELGVGFNPELSGRENIFLNGTILGMSRKYLEKKYSDIVAFAELQDFMEMPLKNYSSGMQLRLGFAIAIMTNSDIFLMDEILAVGDASFQKKCLEVFNQFKREGKTVILVTHDVSMVERICNTAIRLEKGKIVKVGNVNDVLADYIESDMKEEGQIRIKIGNGENENEVNNQNTPKDIEIEGIELFNDKEEKVTNFRTNDFIRMRIKIKRKTENKNSELNFGIGIYRDEGEYIFGCNTKLDEYDVDKARDFIDLNFERFPLLEGKYWIYAVCFAKLEDKFFDYRPKYKSFTVYGFNRKERRGIVALNHSWK